MNAGRGGDQAEKRQHAEVGPVKGADRSFEHHLPRQGDKKSKGVDPGKGGEGPRDIFDGSHDTRQLDGWKQKEESAHHGLLLIFRKRGNQCADAHRGPHKNTRR